MKFLKNNTVKKTMLLSLVLVTFGSVVTSTVAWLKRGYDVSFGNTGNVHINAGAEAAYYGGGDGTKDDPYIISNPNHLYNLAWLQYIGMYNVDDITSDSPNVQIQEKYFKVTDTIDMTGIVLPPIGTETYPFFSHFDGNNQTIENLTISNDNPQPSTSDFGIFKPSFIPDHSVANLTRAEGFFGVVGAIPTNTVLDDEDYEGITPEVKNITLDSITVQTGTHTSPDEVLTGLAAGYFDGTMSGVKVCGFSSIVLDGELALDSTKITKNVSDYGLVGYSTNSATLGTYKQEISKYYDNQNDQDNDGDQWGGSVNMKDMWNRLDTLRGSTYAEATANRVNHQYVYRKSYFNGIEENGKYAVGNTSSIARYNAFNNNASAEIGDYAGSFNYARNVSNSGTKVYMQGGSYVQDYYYVDGTDSGYYIKYDNTHYFTYNGTYNANSEANAPVWHFSGTGNSVRIYTAVYNYNATTREQTVTYYFLRNNNGAIGTRTANTTTDNNNDTRWTVTADNEKLTIDSYTDNSRLVYDGGWKLAANQGQYQVTPPDYYTLKSSNNYYFVTSVTSTTDGNGQSYYQPGSASNNVNNAAHFNLDANGNIYFTRGTTNYYLHICRYRRSNNQTYTTYLCLFTSIQPTARQDVPVGNRTYYYYYSPFNYNTSTTVLSAAPNDTTYYIAYNNGWTYTTTAGSAVTLTGVGGTTANLTLPPRTEGSKTIRSLSDNSGGHMEFTAADTTYYPLNAYNQLTKDKSGKTLGRKYDATVKNTGYVIAGTTDTTYDTMARSVIVSDYARTEKIPNSTELVTVNNKQKVQLTTIKTINENGIVTYDANMIKKLKRFNDKNGVYGSKTKFENILTSSEGQVDGLHFSANKAGETFSITKKNIVNASKVRVNETSYSTYQLPVYSVDFNLSEQGVVNFFAGAYNGNSLDSSSSMTGPGNTQAKINSFFSLHKVYRDQLLLDENDEPILDEDTGLPKKDPTIITDIKEIAQIYSDPEADEGSPYIYTYREYNQNDEPYIVDENGSTNFDYDDYDLEFDTQWLMWRDDINTTANRGYLYYFEIPIDGGEYCLGNVRDKNHTIEGCYLNYLDIAANGNENQAHITAYTITTSVNGYEYPIGVDFDVDGAGNLGGGTVCLIITAPSGENAVGPSGTIGFTVDDDEITIEDTLSITSTYSYISPHEGDLFELGTSSDPPNELLTPVPKISRVTYIGVDEVDGSSYYINIFEDFEPVEVTENGTTTTVEQYVVKNITIHYQPTDGDATDTVTTDLTVLPTCLTQGQVLVLEEKIWELTTAITLQSGMTDTALNVIVNGNVLPWEDADHNPLPYIYAITGVGTSYSLTITVADTGVDDVTYTVKINGETITITNGSGVYPQPAPDPEAGTGD